MTRVKPLRLRFWRDGLTALLPRIDLSSKRFKRWANVNGKCWCLAKFSKRRGDSRQLLLRARTD